jgi:hypothetical protein
MAGPPRRRDGTRLAITATEPNAISTVDELSTRKGYDILIESSCCVSIQAYGVPMQ